jgi:ribosomal protein S12 methylthiotransferase
VQLLKEMLKSDKDFWLRLLYLYPDEINAELIDLIVSDGRICPYLDLPIQHINDEILTAMNRKTSRRQILDILGQLRQKIPSITIRTSLIVGFPGETDEQFAELVSFVEEGMLDHVGIFPFSAEKGAAASRLPGQILDKEKEKRQQILAAAQQKVVKKKNRAMIGRRVLALIDGPHPDSPLLLSAHHAGQCPEIDNQIIINDAPNATAIGRLVVVEITDVAGYDLIGRVIEGEK